MGNSRSCAGLGTTGSSIFVYPPLCSLKVFFEMLHRKIDEEIAGSLSLPGSTNIAYTLGDLANNIPSSNALFSASSSAHSAARGATISSNAKRGGQASSLSSFMASDSMIYSSMQPEAVQLLAQHNYDVNKNISSISTIMETDMVAVDKYDIVNINEHLELIHNNIILKTVSDESKCINENKSNKIEKKWMSDNWYKARKHFLESLGHKSLSLEAIQTVSSNVNQSNNKSSIVNNSLGLMPRQQNASKSAANNSTVIVSALSPLAESHAEIIRSLNIENSTKLASPQPGTNSKTPLLIKPASKLVQSIVSVKNGVSEGLSKDDLLRYRLLMEMMVDMVGESDVFSAEDSASIEAGSYSSLCFDFSTMTSEPASSYDGLLKEQNNLHQKLTIGAKKYFQRLSWEALSIEVEDLQISRDIILPVLQQSNSSHSILRVLRGYANYRYHIGLIPACRNSVIITSNDNNYVSNQVIPVWALVYYCLRCGDITGAIEQLTICVSQHVEFAEIEVLKVLKHLNTILVTKSTASVDLNDYNECIKTISMIYNRERETLLDEESDPFREVIFNILGLADPSDVRIDRIPGSILEDFMWAQLFCIENSRYINCKDSNLGEEILFNRIVDYGGADFFDKDRMLPFNYTIVLLSCHRFGDAVAYLWEASKAYVAVHLMIICLYYGLILPQNPLTHNPTCKKLLLSADRNYAISSTYLSSELLPSTIMQFYFNNVFRNNNPEIVLDYFITFYYSTQFSLKKFNGSHAYNNSTITATLQNNMASAQVVSYDLIEQLIVSLTRNNISQLLGSESFTINKSNENILKGAVDNCVTIVRNKGWLDNYIEPSEILLVISNIALNLNLKYHDIEGSVYLNKIAGRYTEVLDALCTQVHAVMLPPHSKRDRWFALAIDFYDQYIRGVNVATSTANINRSLATLSKPLLKSDNARISSSSIGSVRAKCFEDGRPDLISTFELLLSLGKFIHICDYEKDFQSAINFIDNLKIFPVSLDGDNVELAVSNYLNLKSTNDIRIHKLTDELLLKYMSCIKALFNEFKYNITSNSSTILSGDISKSSNNVSITNMISNLKTRSKAVVAFAKGVSCILSSSDTIGKLSRGEMLIGS